MFSKINIKSFCFKSVWLLLFIAINIIAYFHVASSGLNVGDVSGRLSSSDDSLLSALITINLTYFFIVIFYYCFPRVLFSKFKNKKVIDVYDIKVFNLLLLFIQIAYFLFNFKYGVRAGLNEEISNPLKYLWILIPIDYLFYIYYSVTRRGGLFYCNTLLFAVSNLSRGFAGFLIFIVFIELCKRFVSNRLNFSHFCIFLLLILLYPFIHAVKGASRLTSDDVGFLANFIVLTTDFSISGYFELVISSIEKLVYRLQIVSISSEIISNSSEVNSLLQSGLVTPLWLEGIHGNVLMRLGVTDATINLGTYLTSTSIFSSSAELGSWNTNYGLLTLYFVDKFFLFTALLYLFCVSFFAFYIISFYHAKTRQDVYDLFWIVLIMFVAPPWVSSFITFVYALFIYLLLNLISQKRVRFARKK